MAPREAFRDQVRQWPGKVSPRLTIDDQNLHTSNLRRCCIAFGLLLALYADISAAQVVEQPSRHEFFRVSLGDTFRSPVSGRLLLFIAPVSTDAKDKNAAPSVDMDMMSPTSVYVAAKEVAHLAPGDSVDIDADDVVFPRPLLQAAPGSYRVQAVLDVHHTYNYEGRAAGDLLSVPVTVSVPLSDSAKNALILTEVFPDPPDPLAQRPDVVAALKPLDFVSPVLTAYWGRNIHMRAWVLLPPGYDNSSPGKLSNRLFHPWFWRHAGRNACPLCAFFYDRMKQGQMPEMIWVLLDESSPTGTHEFADSVNNGPWGTALTTELIPKIEADLSHGCATLRALSAGAFLGRLGDVVAADPLSQDLRWHLVDFARSERLPFLQHHRSLRATRELLSCPRWHVDSNHSRARQATCIHAALAGLESVLGEYGGQLASFEWVFSPRAADGRPAPLFDRVTGDIDPNVADYWRTHYDIVQYLNNHSKTIAPDLQGKIHLFVGTDDTFYLDGAAHSLQSTLDRLGIKSEFVFRPGRSHFNLYMDGNDHYALFDRIAAEMYSVARPDKNAH